MLKPLPALRTPQRPPQKYARDLPAGSALQFLAAGWADFRAAPLQSFAYGLILTLLSYAVIALLAWAGLLYLTLPSLSGFLIIGPFLAVGLYETARRHALGQTVSLKEMLLLQPASGAQLAYAGLLLCLLVLFWLRAADLLYALFFGLSPFPGAIEAFRNAFTTPRGFALIGTGTLVGGLFAAFAFAISLFSIPMLIDKRTDALTAIGKSFVMTTQNLPLAIGWGFIVAAGLGLSVATGLLGLIVVFPLLGYGTWHLYLAITDTGPAA